MAVVPRARALGATDRLGRSPPEPAAAAAQGGSITPPREPEPGDPAPPLGRTKDTDARRRQSRPETPGGSPRSSEIPTKFANPSDSTRSSSRLPWPTSEPGAQLGHVRGDPPVERRTWSRTSSSITLAARQQVLSIQFNCVFTNGPLWLGRRPSRVGFSRSRWHPPCPCHASASCLYNWPAGSSRPVDCHGSHSQWPCKEVTMEKSTHSGPRIAARCQEKPRSPAGCTFAIDRGYSLHEQTNSQVYNG